jgi:hypothetical protein
MGAGYELVLVQPETGHDRGCIGFEGIAGLDGDEQSSSCQGEGANITKSLK